MYEPIEFSAFGMLMPGRKYSFDKYRYGFEGQESDKELNENIYTAKYWEYDSRIGRRWNVDPENISNESPYATNRNNPIVYSDPEGNFPGLGFMIGFVTELVIQTIEIKLKIRDEYSIKDMVISGVATQLGMGLAKQISRAKSLSKLGKAVTEFAADAGMSYAEQLAKDPSKANVTDALFNATVSKFAGDFFKKKARSDAEYKKLTKEIREAENSIASSNKPVKPRKIDALGNATEAAEEYLIEKALIKTVPATNAAGKVKEMVVKNLTGKKEEAPAPSNGSTTTGSSMPNIKGLSKYISDIQKQYGSQIEGITYSSIDNNSVGVNITWKGGQGSTSVSFDNRYSTHTMPTPPTK